MRITAQLIDARADRHLWAKSFERSSRDVLALQAELASAIAREINVRLTPSEQSRLTAAPSVNPEAHDAYLKGRYFFNRPSDDNLQKAIAQFEDAVRLSPTFAPAFSGLSDAYLWAGYNEGFLTATEAKPKARAAAEKAVELDDNSAEAHTSLAVFKLFYEYDWAGCEREFRRAFTLNPNYAFAHDQFGMALAFQGRFDEAIAEGTRAIELDPLSPQILLDATVPFMFQRNSEAAKKLARRAAELDPTFFFPVMIDGWADLEVGKFRDAIPALKKAKAMESPPFVTAYLAFAYGAAGDRASAMAELAELKTDVDGWHGAAIQPGAGVPRSWRPCPRARLPRAGPRGRFADDGVDRPGCHLRSHPLRAALRGAPEEDGLQVKLDILEARRFMKTLLNAALLLTLVSATAQRADQRGRAEAGTEPAVHDDPGGGRSNCPGASPSCPMDACSSPRRSARSGS